MARMRLFLATTLLAPLAAHGQTAGTLMAPAAGSVSPGTAMAPAPTAIGPVTGPYISGAVGANWRNSAQASQARLTANTGWLGLGALGWGFGNGLRAEIEGNYRSNDVHRFYPSTGGTNGSFNSYGVMVNGFYDISTGTAFTPYVGVGIGYVWNEIADARTTYTSGAASTAYKLNDTSGSFAYQAILGVAYDFGTGIAATLEYRFLGTAGNTYGISRIDSNPSVQSNVGNIPSSWSPQNALNNSVLVGLRYAFNTPAPAPVPAAVAPAAARTYLVFFDWDRYDLTERARQIIAEAAQTAKSTGTTRIEVAGHADRSGTPQYNQALSQRRADAVAAELVRRGVSRNEIAVSAFGESRPLVPTADGVREPQNRRVEIVLR
jgi:OmpA-OmpF porin, OOP family